MNRSFIASLLLHTALLAVLIFGLRLGEPMPAETPITVEIVAAEAAKPSPAAPRPDPAEAAPLPPRPAAAPPPPPPAPRPAREPEAKPAPPPAPPPPAEAKPEPPPPPKPEPAPKPAEAPKPEPAPAKPQPRPAAPEPPPAPPKAKPEPAREAPEPPRARPEKPAETAKAEPKREPPAAKPEADDFEALLRSVEAQAKRVEAAEKRPGKGASAEAGGTGQPGEAQLARINPSALAAAISRQVTPCWNIPIAAQGIAGLRAELNIVMGPDGSVQSVAPTDAARMRTDPVFRAFAESAVRAVRACSPLKLPAESYQVWRNIIFNFDPSMMTG